MLPDAGRLGSFKSRALPLWRGKGEAIGAVAGLDASRWRYASVLLIGFRANVFSGSGLPNPDDLLYAG